MATNDEARELSACIRDERLLAGQVDDCRTATGRDGLSIGRGDVIQTRQNDSEIRVVNRQTWLVQSVGDDGAVWAKERASSRRQRAVRLPTDYVAEHTHLAYASTAYGMQGATVRESHTVLGDRMDAAGIYVGMTRGRNSNRLHVVAPDFDDAREQFVFATECDRADRGLAKATASAQESMRGLATGTEKWRRGTRQLNGTSFSLASSTRNTPEVGLSR